MAAEKRYYAIGEVSQICGIKPHVLRFWETEFPQLRPSKRRGNRRYYQFADLETVRQIQHLLYDEKYTISGARTALEEARAKRKARGLVTSVPEAANSAAISPSPQQSLAALRGELEDLLQFLERNTR